MGKLSAFLHPVIAPSEKEVFISDRFQEDGKPILFKIRPLTQAQNEALVKAATVTRRGRGGDMVREVDRVKYSRSIVVEGTVYPNFRDPELCEGLGVMDPLAVAPAMLLTGEYQRLADAIAELSGIGDQQVEEAAEEAKN